MAIVGSGADLFPTENPYDFPPDEALTELSEEDQIEALREWFRWNFEDPAEMTPYESAEGGYIYIWGGPYNAHEELGGRFYGVIPDDVIEAAADRIESSGLFDWAPSSNRIRTEYEADADDERGTGIDVAGARKEVRRNLAKLEEGVDRLSALRGMMGHNKPPEPLADLPISVDEENRVRQSIMEIREQTDAALEPRVDKLRSSHQLLSDIANRIGDWISHKANIAAEEAAKSFGKTIGALAAAGVVGAVSVVIVGLWGQLQSTIHAMEVWIKLIQVAF